jgi:hypothetical protein
MVGEFLGYGASVKFSDIFPREFTSSMRTSPKRVPILGGGIGLEVFYLPSYSPLLNPEERLNADLKQEMGKRVPVRTKEKLRDAANDHMAMLEQNPERVMGYFQDRRVRYAA